jgi:hypothetical protein
MANLDAVTLKEKRTCATKTLCMAAAMFAGVTKNWCLP